MSKTSLWMIPLGGLGEFGMNMMALRYGEDLLAIDAGLMFPETELLGVDVVIPDISYLKQNRAGLRALILTHAHEDHIGAVPYLLPELKCPDLWDAIHASVTAQKARRARTARHRLICMKSRREWPCHLGRSRWNSFT